MGDKGMGFNENLQFIGVGTTWDQAGRHRWLHVLGGRSANDARMGAFLKKLHRIDACAAVCWHGVDVVLGVWGRNQTHKRSIEHVAIGWCQSQGVRDIYIKPLARP